jgi:hypothetical protein
LKRVFGCESQSLRSHFPPPVTTIPHLTHRSNKLHCDCSLGVALSGLRESLGGPSRNPGIRLVPRESVPKLSLSLVYNPSRLTTDFVSGARDVTISECDLDQ